MLCIYVKRIKAYQQAVCFSDGQLLTNYQKCGNFRTTCISVG